MKASIEVQADILKTLMCEDRNEIRSIRSSINSQVSFVLVSSFALSGFFLKEKSFLNYNWLTDIAIISFLWIVFFRLKKDLKTSRQCLTARQDLINSLGENSISGDEISLNPFANASGKIPDIKDEELLFLPVLVTALIILK